MNYNNYLNQLADRFKELATSVTGTTDIPTEDYGWINHRYKSQIYRLAHIERYWDKNMEVLHITTFPRRWSPEPIFGFDIITTKSAPIGCYMDLSPGVKTYPFDQGIDFKERKSLPEWATVFSDRFILLKPETEQEFERFCEWSLDKYKWYLNEVLELQERTEDIEEVVQIQNNYCSVQASNPKTLSALSLKIGSDKAKYFMENILFPKIEEEEG